MGEKKTPCFVDRGADGSEEGQFKVSIQRQELGRGQGGLVPDPVQCPLLTGLVLQGFPISGKLLPTLAVHKNLCVSS